jgi:membrane-bound ClpP family serine protease
MEWMGVVLAAIGLCLLLYGFARNNRGVLAVAGLVLFLAGGASDFLRGFADGMGSGDSGASAAEAVAPKG